MSEKKMLQGIASILEETLPEDWSKVVFYAEYAEGAFSIEYYVAGSGKDDFVKCFDQKGFEGILDEKLYGYQQVH